MTYERYEGHELAEDGNFIFFFYEEGGGTKVEPRALVSNSAPHGVFKCGPQMVQNPKRIPSGPKNKPFLKIWSKACKPCYGSPSSDPIQSLKSISWLRSYLASHQVTFRPFVSHSPKDRGGAVKIKFHVAPNETEFQYYPTNNFMRTFAVLNSFTFGSPQKL